MHKRIPGIALAILCLFAGGMYAMRHGAGFFVPESESFDLSSVDEHPITVPYYAFQYLNWTTEWTYTKAETAAEEFDTLIFQALKMLVNSFASGDASLVNLIKQERTQRTNLGLLVKHAFGRHFAMPSRVKEDFPPWDAQ